VPAAAAFAAAAAANRACLRAPQLQGIVIKIYLLSSENNVGWLSVMLVGIVYLLE
jgi:hypothetical protein